MSNCNDLLKSMPEVLSNDAGFSMSEMARTLCRAVAYSPDTSSPQTFAKARASFWPDISKSIEGGAQHVFSADNGSIYAELWYKGGSWYAMTGADPNGDPSFKKSDPWAPYEIKGVYKGMALEEASARFLSTVFTSRLVKAPAGGCGCNKNVANMVKSSVQN